MTKFGRRSDPHQFQFWPSGNFITRNAPFGTQDTPSTCVKIIGSKYVPVIETRIKGSKSDGGCAAPRRLVVLDPIAEKPTRIDPSLLHSNFQSPRTLAANSIVQRTTPLGFRPDSKTAKLSPYSSLPPIQRHRTKNQMSTVFEPECWTLPSHQLLNGKDGDAVSTGAPTGGYLGKMDRSDFLNLHLLSNHQNGNNNEESEKETTSRGVITTDTQTDNNYLIIKNHTESNNTQTDNNYLMLSDPDSDRKYLLSLLPRTLYLPVEPLRLSKDDELKLIRVLNKELQGVHPNQLRDIYTVLSTIDRKLTGWCSFQHLSFALTKKNLHISTDLLRLIAAMFVSPDRHLSGINYEKILSLFGTALKMADDNYNRSNEERQEHQDGGSEPNPSLLHHQSLQKENTSKYFNNPHHHHNNNNNNDITKDTSKDCSLVEPDIAKLIRVSENQLIKAEHRINFDRLSASFQMADRDHRETLSAAQIKDVCYRNDLPLEEWIIDQILLRCCDASIGQYNWHKFVSFLERVQPIHTGLRIPSSKKPLDYVRNYPSPLANWPKATQRSTPETSVPPLWKKDQPIPIEKEKEEDLLPHYSAVEAKNKDNHLQALQKRNAVAQESFRSTSRQTAENNQHSINMEAINKLKSQQVTTSPLNEMTEPWFERFMKLANGLYKQDVDHTGFLPLEEVWKMIATYNQMYNLNLSEDKIEKTLAQSMERDQIDLHQLLTTLGRVRHA